jgi:hypothetical protein
MTVTDNVIASDSEAISVLLKVRSGLKPFPTDILARLLVQAGTLKPHFENC